METQRGTTATTEKQNEGSNAGVRAYCARWFMYHTVINDIFGDSSECGPRCASM